jgi:SAM-dependent methyltransferase
MRTPARQDNGGGDPHQGVCARANQAGLGLATKVGLFTGITGCASATLSGTLRDVDLDRDIALHYGQGVEQDRLATWGRLEAARTRRVLRRYLPAPPAVVLDVGGAEGAYALPLARQGYQVHLIDPIRGHVMAAEVASLAQPDAPLRSVLLGDARALEVADGTADAVLLLGPLYHLIDSGDRALALSEAHRVLRPGGVLIAAAISRFASLLDGVRTGAIADGVFETIVVDDLRAGIHRNPDVENRPEWFTLAYFHRPEDLHAEVIAAGFTHTRVLAVEGPGYGVDPDLAHTDPTRWAATLRAIERVESEPSMLGASPHLLAVGLRGA